MFTIKSVRHVKEFLLWLYTNPAPCGSGGLMRGMVGWYGVGDWELGQKALSSGRDYFGTKISLNLLRSSFNFPLF